MHRTTTEEPGRESERLFAFVSRAPDGSVSLGWVESVVQLVIVVSLAAFALETLPDLTDGQKSVLGLVELGCVGVFSLEYVVRLALTRPWRKYAFSFFGVVDLVAILPFYLSLGVGTESVRALRLLRLFRMLKLMRYNTAMLRFYRALCLAREELTLFGTAALILLYLSGVGVYQFEHAVQPEVFRSVFDGLWWALCTLTTVGYGDLYPVTIGGRIFTFVIPVIGLGVIAVPTGLVASAMSEARHQIEREMDAEARQQTLVAEEPENAVVNRP
ncbi:ion transporter [Nitrogeniibacter aestuarii]|uniref:ion transporter n=1 Tax=Nitrogeniibacter aestuarii TaxID=2815343 RepID=UPI001D122DAE|nr:ion transporter [Nitrogeniibacter aestuarii]